MGIGVSVGVGVGAGVGDGVGVGVAIGVGVGDGVGVGVGAGVGVDPGVGVGAGVGVDPGVGVGVDCGVGDGVGVPFGTGGAARPCGDGAVWMNQSDTLSFVSVPLPAVVPGRRSTLEPAGGAATGVPSTNPFVASPQPTESTTDPPMTRSANAPPVAAKPPEYTRSASVARLPAELATSTRLPGSRGVEASHEAFRVTVEPDDVAYTSSRPARSIDVAPWFAISTNSSDAEAPPVCTSETTSVDVGQLTTAARTGGPAAIEDEINRATMSAIQPARRARFIGGLPREGGLAAGECRL